MLKNQKGFTLIELIVIIVIIGILAAVAIPTYVDLTTQAQDGTARGILGGLRSANSLLYAARMVGQTTAPNNWTNIVGSAGLQGVQISSSNATDLIVTIGATTYDFALNTADPPVITCVGHATW
jgi:prepilin-type N-terminal cleavage/methylation domain-containing protein